MELDEEEVADQFSLGRPLRQARPAATGWGGHNIVWRLDTSDGPWAVKQLRRELPPQAEEAFAIEMAAYDAGIPAARPIRSQQGRCYEFVGGTPIRCHEWVPGSAKSNDEASPDDAFAMGLIVARLHALGLPRERSDPGEQSLIDKDRWLRLAGDAALPWASLVRDRVDELLAVGQLVRHREPIPEDRAVVGGHRDLNAHNVLFGDGLVLVDWDSAGPACIPFERSVCPVLWAQEHDGGHHLATAAAFVCGYCEAGGEVESDDAEAMWTWLRSLIWWAEQNLRLACTLQTPEQDRNALYLVDAVLRGPDTIATMQRVFVAAVGRL